MGLKIISRQLPARVRQCFCVRRGARPESLASYGLYAAGDLVRGLNQVVVAAAEAAIAATDIHNKLRGLRSDADNAA
jgi:hypothetical protein